MSSASDSVYHVLVDPDTGGVDVHTLTDPLMVDPVCVQVSDDGRVCVAAGDALIEFDPAGFNSWARSDTPIFADAEVGDHFQLARSRDNFDPDLHAVEEWRDVLPIDGLGDPILDCIGDTDGDGDVDVDDLNNIILDWNTDGSAHNADVTGPLPGSPLDGVVNVNDLNAVIVNWGDCP